MNLKTLLFKLKLRKVRSGDHVIVTEEKGNTEVKKIYLVIGKQFNIKKDRYNRQESKGMVAVLQTNNFIVLNTHCEDYNIDKKYIGKHFRLIRTKDIVEVY